MVSCHTISSGISIALATCVCLLLLCACADIKSPRLAHHDPGHKYQSRQDAYFDGCKAGAECDRPISDPALKEVIATTEEMEKQEALQNQ